MSFPMAPGVDPRLQASLPGPDASVPPPMDASVPGPAMSVAPPYQMAPSVVPSAPMMMPDGSVVQGTVGAAPPVDPSRFRVVGGMPGGEAQPEDPNADIKAAMAAELRAAQQPGGGGAGVAAARKAQAASIALGMAGARPLDAAPVDEKGAYEIQEIASAERARRASSAQAYGDMSMRQAEKEEAAEGAVAGARDEAKELGEAGSALERMSPAQRVMVVLGEMFGAYGAVKGTPGKNMGHEVFTAFEAADAAAQRRKYAAAKNRVEEMETTYGRLRARGLDDKAAFEAAQATSRQEHAMAAWKLAATSGDPATKLRATELALDIEGRGEGTAPMRETFSDAGKTKAQLAAKLAELQKPVGGPGGKRKTPLEIMKEGAEVANIRAQTGKTTAGTEKERSEMAGGIPKDLSIPDGRGGFARAVSPASAAQMRDAYGIVREIQTLAKQNADLARGFQLGQLSPTQRRIYKSNMDTIARLRSKVEDNSVLRDAEAVRAFEILGDAAYSPGAADLYDHLGTVYGNLYAQRANAGVESDALVPVETPPER